MRRTFIQDPGVTDLLRRNGVSDVQLPQVEMAIMRGDGDTISGTSGLKKIRCASKSRGKSGSVRLIFADYPLAGRVYLLAAFGKNEKANLSAADRRELALIKQMLDKFIGKLVKYEKR